MIASAILFANVIQGPRRYSKRTEGITSLCIFTYIFQRFIPSFIRNVRTDLCTDSSSSCVNDSNDQVTILLISYLSHYNTSFGSSWWAKFGYSSCMWRDLTYLSPIDSIDHQLMMPDFLSSNSWWIIYIYIFHIRYFQC